MVEQQVKVSIKAIVDGLQNVKELQSAVKHLQAQGNKKLGIDTSGGQSNTLKFINILRQLSPAADSAASGIENITGAIGGGGLLAVAGPAVGVVGALGAGMVSAGAFALALAKHAADAGSELHDLSQRTGVSVETLSAFRLVAKQSDTSLDDFGDGVSRFNRTIGAAARGSDEAKEALKRFGIDPQKALNDQQGALARVFQVINSLPPGLQRANAAQLAFGRGGDRLVDMIQNVGGNLDEFMEKARESGLVMSTEAAAAADEFGDKLDELFFKASEVGREIGQGMIPALMRGLDSLNTSLNNHRGVVTFVSEGVGAFLNDYITRLELAIALTGKLAQYTLGFNPFQIPRKKESEGTKVVDVGNSVPIDPATGKPLFANFFSPEQKEKRERARRDELERLKKFAQEWGFVITSITEGKHNPGSLHAKGRAVDVSVKGKADDEIRAFIEAAAKAGFGVRDERTRPVGQAVWSGPHLHLELITKAAQAANEEFVRQGQVLTSLAQKMAEAELGLLTFGQSTVEQELAATRLSLGIGTLTGEASELAERMMRDYEETLKSREAKQKQAEAVEKVKQATDALVTALRGEKTELEKVNELIKDADALKAIDARTAHWLRLLAVLNDIKAATQSISPPWMPEPEKSKDEKDGPWVDPEEFERENGPAPEAPDIEWIKKWRRAVEEVEGIFTDFFLDLEQGFGVATRNMLLSFLNMIQRMIAEALAARLVKALFGSSSEDEGEGGGGLLGGLIVPIFGGRFSHGGLIKGKGTPTSDSILARVSNGEFVIREAAVRSVGADVLAYINNLGRLPLPSFATGGFVGDIQPAGLSGVGGTVIHQHFTGHYNVQDGQLTSASRTQLERDAARLTKRGALRSIASNK